MAVTNFQEALTRKLRTAPRRPSAAEQLGAALGTLLVVLRDRGADVMMVLGLGGLATAGWMIAPALGVTAASLGLLLLAFVMARKDD